MANPYFNAAYYLANNPDLVRAGLTVDNVEQHYLQYGAAESVNPGSTRQPNPWFNADFYLRSNPDLIQAGLTLADALAHYAQYGVYEGRVFSTNPALAPSKFDAKTYATTNTDVATALGITDVNNLTAAQKGALLGHFQAYGYNEPGRTAGFNADGVAFVGATAAPVIDVAAGTVTLGTTANDVFNLATVVNGSTYSVNGLEGNDTLKIGTPSTDGKITLANVETVEITGKAGTDKLTVSGTGVQSVVFDNAANAFAYVGAKVDTVTLKGTGVVSATFNNATGTSDALAVETAVAAQLKTTGIEQVNLKVGADIATGTVIQIDADSVQGTALTVTLTGGKAAATATAAGGSYTVDLGSALSGDLATVKIDGSAALGNQTLQLDGGLAPTASVSATLIGGAGKDVLHASATIDTLTGNGGGDVFTFAQAGDASFKVENSKVTSFDIITDFTKGSTAAATDKISMLNLAIDTGGDFSAIGTYSTTTGVLEFNTGYTTGKDLFQILDALDNVLSANEGVVFNFGGNAYVFQAGATSTALGDDGLIQLTGVDATQLTLGTAGEVNFV